ncbi:MAG: FecR domain-containing protein [Candidatus Riflebacteria bacterium]|nr:FecR domain-containing protein [Candidatus Riflebacteria bacterium]
MKDFFRNMLKLLLIILVSSMLEASDEKPYFIRGTNEGCFVGTEQNWLPLMASKILCRAPLKIKTGENAWGTIVYPFSSITLRPQSEVEFKQDSLIIKKGSFRAVVFSISNDVKFRTPQVLLGIRGTIFSASGNGGVTVEEGKVEATSENGSSSMLLPGQSLGASESFQMPATLQRIEEALTYEHDRKYDEAANIYLDLFKDPGFANLPDYRSNLLEMALTDTINSDSPQSNSSKTKEVYQTLAEALKEFPEVWYETARNVLSSESKMDIAKMSELTPKIHPFDPANPRDQLIKGLQAEIQMNDKSLFEAVKGIIYEKTLASAAETLQGFWADTKTFLQLLTFPNTVTREQATNMISPDSLKSLSPTAVKKRILVASSLPNDLLEAQGLYFLIKAYLSDNRLDEALKVMDFLFKHHPNSPWTLRGKNAIERFKISEKNAKIKVNQTLETASQTEDLSFVSRMVSNLNSAIFEKNQNKENATETLQLPGESVTGKTASAPTPKLNDKPMTPSGSLQRGF